MSDTTGAAGAGAGAASAAGAGAARAAATVRASRTGSAASTGSRSNGSKKKGGGVDGSVAVVGLVIALIGAYIVEYRTPGQLMLFVSGALAFAARNIVALPSAIVLPVSLADVVDVNFWAWNGFTVVTLAGLRYLMVVKREAWQRAVGVFLFRSSILSAAFRHLVLQSVEPEMFVAASYFVSSWLFELGVPGYDSGPASTRSLAFVLWLTGFLFHRGHRMGVLSPTSPVATVARHVVLAWAAGAFRMLVPMSAIADGPDSFVAGVWLLAWTYPLPTMLVGAGSTFPAIAAGQWIDRQTQRSVFWRAGALWTVNGVCTLWAIRAADAVTPVLLPGAGAPGHPSMVRTSAATSFIFAAALVTACLLMLYTWIDGARMAFVASPLLKMRWRSPRGFSVDYNAKVVEKVSRMLGLFRKEKESGSRGSVARAMLVMLDVFKTVKSVRDMWLRRTTSSSGRDKWELSASLKIVADNRNCGRPLELRRMRIEILGSEKPPTGWLQQTVPMLAPAPLKLATITTEKPVTVPKNTKALLPVQLQATVDPSALTRVARAEDGAAGFKVVMYMDRNAPEHPAPALGAKRAATRRRRASTTGAAPAIGSALGFVSGLFFKLDAFVRSLLPAFPMVLMTVQDGVVQYGMPSPSEVGGAAGRTMFANTQRTMQTLSAIIDTDLRDAMEDPDALRDLQDIKMELVKQLDNVHKLRNATGGARPDGEKITDLLVDSLQLILKMFVEGDAVAASMPDEERERRVLGRLYRSLLDCTSNVVLSFYNEAFAELCGRDAQQDRAMDIVICGITVLGLRTVISKWAGDDDSDDEEDESDSGSDAAATTVPTLARLGRRRSSGGAPVGAVGAAAAGVGGSVGAGVAAAAAAAAAARAAGAAGSGVAAKAAGDSSAGAGGGAAAPSDGGGAEGVTTRLAVLDESLHKAWETGLNEAQLATLTRLRTAVKQLKFRAPEGAVRNGLLMTAKDITNDNIRAAMEACAAVHADRANMMRAEMDHFDALLAPIRGAGGASAGGGSQSVQDMIKANHSRLREAPKDAVAADKRKVKGEVPSYLAELQARGRKPRALEANKDEILAVVKAANDLPAFPGDDGVTALIGRVRRDFSRSTMERLEIDTVGEDSDESDWGTLLQSLLSVDEAAQAHDAWKRLGAVGGLEEFAKRVELLTSSVDKRYSYAGGGEYPLGDPRPSAPRSWSKLRDTISTIISRDESLFGPADSGGDGGGAAGAGSAALAPRVRASLPLDCRDGVEGLVTSDQVDTFVLAERRRLWGSVTCIEDALFRQSEADQAALAKTPGDASLKRSKTLSLTKVAELLRVCANTLRRCPFDDIGGGAGRAEARATEVKAVLAKIT